MAANERKILTTLALDGDAAFKKSMDEAYNAMKVLGSEMKLNTSIFGDNAKSMEGLTNKGEILRKEIAQQKEIVAALSKAVEESATAYGENDKRTDSYRTKLNNAKTALNEMEGKLRDNESAIQGFGDQTQAAEKKTVDWKKSLDDLDSALGKGIKACEVALGAVAAVGAGFVAAGKQVFDATVETGKFADELMTTSKQTGISTQTLQEWTYAAQFIDTEVETMTGSMAKMIRQMASAKEGTGASAEAFKALGIGIVDSSGQFINSQTVFMQAIDALGRVANETERDALAMQIFGKSAQDLNPLIQAGSAELQRLGQEAQNSGIIMSTQTLTAFGAFDDSMNVLNSTLAGVKNSFLSALLPAIQSIIPVVQDLAVKFGEWLRSDGAQAMLASLAEKISSIATNIGGNLTPIVNGAIAAFQSITSAIGWAINNFEGIKNAVIAVVSVLTTLKVIQGAVAVAQGIVNAVMLANPFGLIVAAIAAVVAAIALLIANWDKVKQAISKVWESIKSAVSAGVEAVKNAFTGVINFLGNLISGVWNAGVNLVKGLWEGIKSATTWLWNKIKGWIDDALGWIADFLGIHSPSTKMRDMIGKPMVQGMAEGIIKNARLVDDAMSNLVPDAKSTSLALDVTRRFNDVAGSAMSYSRTNRTHQTMELSDTAVTRIVRGFKDAIREQGDTVLTLDDRELGRAMRKVAMA